MKLLKLRLENFKGIRDLTLEPNGSDLSIYGDNGTGKSSIADFLCWLMTGKDSLGRADFEIKTVDAAGKVIPGLNHGGEAVFELPNGNLTLRKVYKEVWTKKRGSAASEFSGHTTDHWINGVPVQEKEYKARLAEIAPEKTLRLLMDPSAFNLLPWQERRKLLLEVCGDISDAEVIASDKRFNDLPQILGAHTIEEYRKIIAARRREINNELDRLPVRIDEVSRGLPEGVALDEAMIEALQADLQSLQERRASASAGGEIATKTTELRVIEGELQDILNGLQRESAKEREAALASARAKDEEIESVRSKLRIAQQRASAASAEIRRLDPLLVRLREKWDADKAKAPTIDESCPACGQALPLERREEALAAFNETKAQRLEDLKEEGTALRKQRDAQQAALAAASEEIGALEAEIAALQEERAAITVPAASSPDPLASPAYTAKLEEKSGVEAQIADMRLGAVSALAEIDELIAKTRGDLEQLERAKAANAQRAAGIKRIETLRAEQKKLAEELEKLESELFLTEEFVRAKVSLLTEKINSRFQTVRWMLFEEQVNGGLQEVCTATVDGVPFDAGLNHGACVNAGLECVRVLQEHFGLHPVVIVDGCESVTRLIPMNCQLIRLVVSAPDKALRIEQEPTTSTTTVKSRSRVEQEELIPA